MDERCLSVEETMAHEIMHPNWNNDDRGLVFRIEIVRSSVKYS